MEQSRRSVRARNAVTEQTRHGGPEAWQSEGRDGSPLVTAGTTEVQCDRKGINLHYPNNNEARA
jgi:hypothetical protein